MSSLDAVKHADRAASAGPAPHQSISQPRALRSPKILDWHLDRLAIVYVRQSDPYQVLNHRESRERQYALADHAAALGWTRDRILIIDDDQGVSLAQPTCEADFNASSPKLPWSTPAWCWGSR